MERLLQVSTIAMMAKLTDSLSGISGTQISSVQAPMTMASSLMKPNIQSVEVAPPSSPIRGPMSRRQIIDAFFEWIIKRYAVEEGLEDEVRAAGQKINNALLKLEDLKNEAVVSNQYWEKLGAPLGILIRIRETVSEWKRQQKEAQNIGDTSESDNKEDSDDFEDIDEFETLELDS
jgi:hypothetical protein